MHTYDLFFLIKTTLQFFAFVLIGLLLSSAHIRGKFDKDDKKSIKALTYFKYLLSFTYIINVLIGFFSLGLVFLREGSVNLNVTILDINYSLVLLPVWHSIAAVLYLLLTFSQLLYYRFRPDYRNIFMKKFLYMIFFVYLVDITASIYLLNASMQSLILPQLSFLGTEIVQQIIKPDMIIALGALFLLFLAGHIYFRKKKSGFSIVILCVIYLPLIVFTLINLEKILSLYFSFNKASIKSLTIFSSEYLYIGLLLIFISVISIYSLMLTLFITLKSDQFIARQFVAGYSIYLARINFWSSLFLFILVNLPFIYRTFFQYVL